MTKREELLQGALVAFSRRGYVHARIVDIAAKSGVSTRTIYNLFTDKPGLFAAVIEHTASHFVAQRLLTIDNELSKTGSIETILTAFAVGWLKQSRELALHMQLGRRIEVEREDIPQRILDVGLRAGPERVQRAISNHLQRFMLAGMLRQTDAHTAALHLLQLIEGVPEVRGYYSATGMNEKELEEVARGAVHAYLHGYLGKEAA
ncbi:TetR/AcrR family transcriptional regulator [Brachybacterium tyrofermentans]|uniref:TetR/AcrR family transcriptional regulator n=1 Tax=Brachybacterium tyrofermentans TaxID=47848 RepID=UPI003FD60E7F